MSCYSETQSSFSNKFSYSLIYLDRLCTFERYKAKDCRITANVFMYNEYNQRNNKTQDNKNNQDLGLWEKLCQ